MKLLPAGITAKKGVAVLVDAVAEVLTGHANAGSLPALDLAIDNKVPFLHGYPLQHTCSDTDGWLSAIDIPKRYRTSPLSPNRQRDIEH